MALYGKSAGASGIIYISTLKLDDTDSSHYLTLDWNENDTADRALYLKVGGADRTITLSGSPTLGDWFDQSVKTTASPGLYGATFTQQNSTTGIVIKNAATFDLAYPPLSFQDSTGADVGSMFIDPTGNIFIGDKTMGTLYGSIVIGSMAGGYLDLAEYVNLFGTGAGQNMVAGGYAALLGPGAGDIPAYSNFLTVTGVYSSPYIYSVTFSATPSAGAGLELGNYRYLFTYVLDGVETTCSTWHTLGTPITSGNQRVSITGIPTYDGPRTCTARKIYRTKVSTSENLAKFYLLATIADNITTTYLDSTADAALGAILSKIDDIAVFGNWLLQTIMPDTLYLGGGAGHDMPNVVFGDEWDATPVGTTLHSQGGSGANVTGSNFTIAPGQGTGTGAGGSFIVQVASAGGAGSTWNALADALTIDSTKAATFAGTINGLTLASAAVGFTIAGGTTSKTLTLDADGAASTWNAKQTQGTGLDAINAGTWTGANSITTLGTVGTGTWNATAISVGKGGTGLTSYAVGDILYASAVDTIGKLVDVATGSVIVSGGIGAAPAYSASPTLTTSLTVPTITLGSITANGILNLYGLHANGYYHIIQGSVAEGLTGSDLRIGLDESLRMLRICDRGDIATDGNFSAMSNPTLILDHPSGAGSGWARFDYTGITQYGASFTITTSANSTIFSSRTDLASGSKFVFQSETNIELTDTDGQQAWVYLEPKCNQSGTAAFDALYINPTLTGVGSGATGDGNNLLRLAVSAATKFKVDTAGSMTLGQTSVSLADDAVHDTGLTSFFGMLIVKDTTTGVTGLFRLDGGATPTIVSAHANFSTTQGTDNKINVYFATTYKIENCNAAASVVKCAFIGC